MSKEKDETSDMDNIQQPRNFVAKYAHQINKAGKIDSGKDKARRRQPKHRHREQGFTLIELMVSLVFCLCIVLMVALAVTGHGFDQTTCVGGYVHSYDMNGNLRQVVNEQGGGIRCN